ncbi:MAG: hypothetical protein E7161_01405 [Firmicutes bacterium]|nr:hypothetical protein [Bacillota bacterium]
MSNEIFLAQMKYKYESLQYFSIQNGLLVLNYQGTFTIPFENVYLANLNENLFLMDPNEIFHILYMLELLPKPQLNNFDEEFIINYVNRYLQYNDSALEHSNNPHNNEALFELKKKLSGFQIPIYLSYDPQFENTPTSIAIQNIMNLHSEEIEQGKGNHQKLVRINPKFAPIEEESNLVAFEKAGFTTLILIITAIVATCLYIAFFMVNA